MPAYYRYNGTHYQGNKGRRRSKFTLYRRPQANGVKPVKSYVVENPKNSDVGPTIVSFVINMIWFQ
jgi:hypothetical protein